MLQAISSGGAVGLATQAGEQFLVHPGRDVAYCMPKVIRTAVANLSKGSWKQAAAVAAKCGITPEEVYEAFACLVGFVNTQPDVLEEDPTDSMVNSLKRCGFLQHKPEAQVLAMAYMSLPVMGMFWKGVRDAGAQPQSATYQTELNEHMRKASELFKAQFNQ